MAHALETLRVFAAFCTTSGIHAEEVEAVATSAIRDAPNGGAFVERAQRETGLPIRVLSRRGGGAVLLRGGGQLDLAVRRGRARPRRRRRWSWWRCASGARARSPRGRWERCARPSASCRATAPAKAGAIAKLHARTLRALEDAPWVAGAGRRRALVGLGGSVRNLAAAAIRARGAAARQRAGVRARRATRSTSWSRSWRRGRPRSASACRGSSAGAAR